MATDIVVRAHLNHRQANIVKMALMDFAGKVHNRIERKVQKGETPYPGDNLLVDELEQLIEKFLTEKLREKDGS